jgi:hypothetical protein
MTWRSYHFIFFALLILSCSSPRKTINSIPEEYDCPRVEYPKDITIYDSLDLLKHTVLIDEIGYTNSVIVNAFGIVDDAEKLLELKEKLKLDSGNLRLQIEVLSLENQIDNILNRADWELTSTVNYIDCLISELRKKQVELDAENNNVQNRLTNWATVTGAITTVITASILLSGDENLIGSPVFDWIAIPTGVASTYMAIRSTKIDKRIRIKNQHNIIKSIHSGTNIDNVFPDNIWYLLNSYIETPTGVTTLRNEIIKDWNISTNMLADPKNNELFPLLLLDEADYSVDLLNLRIEMLDAINIGIDNVVRYMLKYRR